LAKGIKYLDDREVKAFFDAIPEDNCRDRLIFKLMLDMGLRVAEIVGDHLDYWTHYGRRIPAKDVPKDIYDLAKPNQKEIDGYRHIISGQPGIFIEDIDWEKRLVAIHGKGKKERVLYIVPEVYDILFKFVEPYSGSNTGRLVCKSNRASVEEPITTEYVRQLCRRYAKQAGIQRPIHPHQFRHTFAIRWLNATGKLRVLQKLLGHSSLSRTEIYLDYTDQDVIDEVKRIAERKGKVSPEEAREIATDIIKEVMDRFR
jgi:site-specific recombinase XerD